MVLICLICVSEVFVEVYLYELVVKSQLFKKLRTKDYFVTVEFV